MNWLGPSTVTLSELKLSPSPKSVSPGKGTFTLKKGHYVLLCDIPGHYKGGMRADFTVK